MPHDDRSSDSALPERAADDAWLAGLAGRAVEREGAARIEGARKDAHDEARDGARSDVRAAEREAVLMREALRRWAPAVDALADRDPERIAKLIERARAEGLFDERAGIEAARVRRAPERRGWFAWLFAWWTRDASSKSSTRPAWAMAAVAGAIVVLAFVMRPANEGAGGDESAVRTAPDSVTLLRASDPDTLRREIVDSLRQQGIAATTYSRFGRAGLDADLPQPLSQDVKAVLDRYRIPAPGDGVLRVEIEATR